MDERQQQLKHLLTTTAEAWGTDEAPAILTTPHRFLAFNQHLCHQGQSSAVTVREGNHDK